jgi:hypothetical protein
MAHLSRVLCIAWLLMPTGTVLAAKKTGSRTQAEPRGVLRSEGALRRYQVRLRAEIRKNEGIIHRMGSESLEGRFAHARNESLRMKLGAKR